MSVFPAFFRGNQSQVCVLWVIRLLVPVNKESGRKLVFQHFLGLKRKITLFSNRDFVAFNRLLFKMPPKRKAASAATSENVDSTDQVKQKKGRKPKAAADVNDVNQDEDNVSSPPKRSRPVRSKKEINYKELDVSELKPKKEPKTKKVSKKEKASTKVKHSQPGPSKQLTPEPDSPKERKKEKKEKIVKVKKSKPKKKGELIGEEHPTNEESENERIANGRPQHAPLVLEEAEPKNEKVLLNKTDTEWDTIDFNCSRKNGYEVGHNLIISTWNVGGLKSWIKKGCMKYLDHERPDIFCVQETKCNEQKLPEELTNLKDYHQYWCSSEKEGYAGVGLLTIKKPKNVTYGINNKDQDVDGRCITAEYDDFILINVYVPNAGRKLVTLSKRLEWNKLFKDYVKALDKKKPVIICGDMNVSHNEIDLARPQSNNKSAGFTPEEREGMTELLKEGFVDVFRHIYPEDEGVYSFWTYMSNARAKNVGWRLDYIIVSERILKGVCDTSYRTQVLGSDHCPQTLFINI